MKYEFGKKVVFAVLLMIVFCTKIHAQHKETMLTYQNDLNELFNQVFKAPTDNERYNANEQVLLLMEEALLQPKSFSWKWNFGKGVSVLKSDDDKFKIFTWAVVRDNGEYECFGYLQVLNENADVYEICALNDKSDDLFNPEEAILDEKNWYGAIYQELITTKYENRTYYTLLGWSGNNTIIQRKVIEPISFKMNSTRPTFGHSIFRNGKNVNKNYRRIIFKYAKDAMVNLQYDKQFLITTERKKIKKNGKMVTQMITNETQMPMIVFDKIGPRVDGMEKLYQYYVPTGQEDGYVFDKGRWVLKENIRCKLDKKKTLDEAKPLEKKKPAYIVQ